MVEGNCAALFSQGPNTTSAWHRIELQNYQQAHGDASTINQFRLTNVSCYTGGTDIVPGTRHFRFLVRGGSFNPSSGCSFPAGKDFDIGAFNYNQWYTMQYHYICSSGSAGLAEVWVNGAKVVTFHGPSRRPAVRPSCSVTASIPALATDAL